MSKCFKIDVAEFSAERNIFVAGKSFMEKFSTLLHLLEKLQAFLNKHITHHGYGSFLFGLHRFMQHTVVCSLYILFSLFIYFLTCSESVIISSGKSRKPKVHHHWLRHRLLQPNAFWLRLIMGGWHHVGSIFLLQLNNFHSNWRIISVKTNKQTKQDHLCELSCFTTGPSEAIHGTHGRYPALLKCNYPWTFITSHYEYLISEKILQKRRNLVIFQIIIIHNRLLCCHRSVGFQKIIR